MSGDLAADTWSLVRDRPDGSASGPGRVMENLTAFQADPCASTWYGFVVRLGLLLDEPDVQGLIGALDPFPSVTTLALADVRLAAGVAAEPAEG